MTTIKQKVHFRNGQRTQKNRRNCGTQRCNTVGHVPCVSRLVPSAIRLDQLIHAGEVTDQAELARVDQIMILLCLAPSIQEKLLFLPPTERGRDAVTEGDLRPIAGTPSWKRQRQIWRRGLILKRVL